MKRIFLFLFLLCGITNFAVGQGKLLKAIKKGVESTTGIKTSNETVFVYPEMGAWKMSLVHCRGEKSSGNVNIVINVTRLLGGDIKNQPCIWKTYSINGETSKKNNTNTLAETLYDFITGNTVKVAFKPLPNVSKEAKTINLEFQILGQKFEARRIPVEWGEYHTVVIEDPENQEIVGVVTETDTIVDIVTTYIPPKYGSKTVTISKTVPQYKLKTEEKYVAIDCSEYVERVKTSQKTILDTVTVVEEDFVYGHVIDIEVIEKNYPYTSFFYLHDDKGEIIDVSESILDNEQREYSLFFTSTYAKKFPFYEAIKPMSMFMMGLGAMMGGETTIGGNKTYMTEENAPVEVKTLVTNFFNNTQNGYIIATEGKMDTEERNRKAYSMLQQNYLRFFDDCLRAEFPDEDMTDRLVKFEDNYIFDIDGNKSPMKQASDEVKALFDYIKGNPVQESTYSFLGDNTAKKYTFEYRFYDDELVMFAMLFTPLTMHFDVRTFYDEYSDATYFIYFYSLGYDKEGINKAGRLGFDRLTEDIKESCGFSIADYLLSPMDVLVEKLFTTFQAVKINIEEFLLYSLRVEEYITMHDVVITETETLKIDCSYLEKQTTAKWVKNYITFTEKVKIPTYIPGKWIKELKSGEVVRIVGYITIPSKIKRRIWRPDYVTFGRGEKSNIGTSVSTTNSKPVEVKKPDVEFDKPPVLSASATPYVALQDFAPTDIAEDARYIYIIAQAGYDNHSLLAIEKESGKIKKVKSAPANKSSHYPRKVMRDGNGRVLVEIASTGVFLCKGFDEPIPTNLQLYSGGQWNELINSELMGIMPDGNILVYRGYQDIVIQDRNSGDVKAQTDKLKYTPSNEYKKLLAIVSTNGDILRCFDQYSQGKLESLSGLASGNAVHSVSDVKTLLGDKYRKVQRILTAPSGAIVAITDFGVHRSADGGKTWKSVNKDSYDHTLVDLAVDSKDNVYVIYQKAYGNYELRKYSPDLSKGLLSTKIESKIPIIRQGTTLEGKFAGVGSEPKMIYVDSVDNLWILGGGNEYTQGLLIFNPNGITGFPELTEKKSIVMKELF